MHPRCSLTTDSRFEAIIFDMDGVLLDSTPIHRRAYGEALARFPEISFEYASVAGMRTDEALRLILANNGVPHTPELIQSLAESKSAIARKLIDEENPVAPGCADTIASLSESYILVLASSASQATVDLFLNRNCLRGYFAVVLHGGEVKRAKPDPEIYRLACARIEVPASRCLIIEDAVSGVLAGKGAGATVWGVTATCPAQMLKEGGADRIIGRLEDLGTLLLETQ